MKVITIIAILLCPIAIAQSYFLRGKADMEVRRHRVFRKRLLEDNVEPDSSTFGTVLFKEICQDPKLPQSSNVLFSPLSVYQALALAKDGATIGSDNENELEQLLGPDDIQNEYLSLQEQASGDADPDSDVQLTMATSIWADELKQEYIDMAKDKYSAGAFPLPSRWTPVDDWIRNKTNGMIPNLMGDEPLDPLIVALLVNAVYFKGVWTNKFNVSDTTNGSFFLRNNMPDGNLNNTLSDTSTVVNAVEARFMNAHGGMKVIKNSVALGGASAVVLDYGELVPEQDAEYQSIFILPASNSVDSMNDVITGLQSRPITELFDEAWPADTILKLPRFRLQFGLDADPIDLKPMLQRMDMDIAFNPGILDKFLQMTAIRDAFVSNVYHGALMEVTEEGTEAAAATVVVFSRKSIPRTFVLTFDRPFVVVVLHQPTGIPLFMGRVEQPDFFFE